ncbi:unnamed protein product, partial [Ilex paraguariensis]
ATNGTLGFWGVTPDFRGVTKIPGSTSLGPRISNKRCCIPKENSKSPTILICISLISTMSDSRPPTLSSSQATLCGMIALEVGGGQAAATIDDVGCCENLSTSGL